MQEMTAQKPLIVFDVNETLLDLEFVSPVFERIFGDKTTMRLWFANLVLYSEALTLAGVYVPFTSIGGAVLQMLARLNGLVVTMHDKHELTEAFASMPPHPDVLPGLTRLREAGFRLFTLTNNLPDIQARQLQQGGIIHHFEDRFSVDATRSHKPARLTYGHVEAQLRARPEQLLLIACHAWDTIGARGAGWNAALIKRPGNDVLDVGPQPQFVGRDLTEIAEQLIQHYSLQPRTSI